MEPILTLSPGAAFAIGRLESRGYEAYAVGGCVRDSLLGKVPHDWDLTTSATPDETLAAFADCRVIETGVKHGTVTVLYGGEPLEITTYRLDGAYADNRHPTSVTFSKTLEDDLSRRDFTVNAMAYHPKRGLVDLFGGRDDPSRGVIRCVGDPATRFGEDGLRILRAVRFASVLGFSLDPATAGAVHARRSLLGNIARERVREEWNKLLLGKTPAAILRDYADVAAEVIPEIAPAVTCPQNVVTHCYPVFEHTLAALTVAPADLVLRLAVIFHDLGKPGTRTETPNGDRFPGHAERSAEIADEAMRRLRYDNATREETVRLVRLHDSVIPATEKGVRRLLRELPPESVLRLMELKKCDRAGHAPDYRYPAPEVERIPGILQTVLARGDCVSLHTLAVNGKDLLSLGVPAGRDVGALLERLLDRVVDGDLPNEKQALLAEAKRLFR